MCVLGLRGLLGVGRKDFSVREVCRKDVALLEKGKGTL